MFDEGRLEDEHARDAEGVFLLTNHAGKGQVFVSTVVFVDQIVAINMSGVADDNRFRTEHAWNDVSEVRSVNIFNLVR